MRQDLGQILEKAVRQSGYPISKLAKRIGYTRQHMYNLFAQQQVDLNLLDEIGKIIHVDFSDKVKGLKKYADTLSAPDDSLKEQLSINQTKKNDELLQQKYLVLLEEYNILLKEHHNLMKLKLKDYLKKM